MISLLWHCWKWHPATTRNEPCHFPHVNSPLGNNAFLSFFPIWVGVAAPLVANVRKILHHRGSSGGREFLRQTSLVVIATMMKAILLPLPDGSLTAPSWAGQSLFRNPYRNALVSHLKPLATQAQLLSCCSLLLVTVEAFFLPAAFASFALSVIELLWGFWFPL